MGQEEVARTDGGIESSEPDKPFQAFGIVELFDHRRYGARIEEVCALGVRMLRAVVLTEPPFELLVGAAAIFVLTRCDEAEARRACAPWMIPPELQHRQLGIGTLPADIHPPADNLDSGDDEFSVSIDGDLGIDRGPPNLGGLSRALPLGLSVSADELPTMRELDPIEIMEPVERDGTPADPIPTAGGDLPRPFSHDGGDLW